MLENEQNKLKAHSIKEIKKKGMEINEMESKQYRTQ